MNKETIDLQRSNAELQRSNTEYRRIIDEWQSLWDTETARRQASWNQLIDMHRSQLRQAAQDIAAAQEAMNGGDIEHAKRMLMDVSNELHEFADVCAEHLPGVWMQIEGAQEPSDEE